MADNIFDATLDVDNDVKVNNFDWSHANNLTTQIGRITPIFCDMVPAKTSFRVNPRFGLQFMPMMFPIQTRMKARISFYRYPLRALWKDYKDFIGNFREGLEEPYINFNTAHRLEKMASTGSLGDYLGLPTTVFGQFGGSDTLQFEYSEGSVKGNVFNGTSDFQYLPSIPVRSASDITYLVSQKGLVWQDNVGALSYVLSSPGSASSSSNEIILGRMCSTVAKSVLGKLVKDSRFVLKLRFDNSFSLSDSIAEAWYSSITGLVSASGFYDLTKLSYSKIETSDEVGIDITFSYPDLTIEKVNGYSSSPMFFFVVNWFNQIGRRISGNDTAWSYSTVRLSDNLSSFDFISGSSKSLSVTESSLYGVKGTFFDYSEHPVDVSLSTSPWYNSDSPNKDKQQKILAYGFRAYEGIYNAFFRDNRNNPYYLNGQVQYNQWIPTDAGGEDNELYELRYANWEKDFLTTAVQSPQQGNAPLVGITTYTQTVDNGDGTRTELIKTSLVDEDGKKYGLSFKSSDEGLEGVEYVELDNGTAVRQARSLYDLATSGISIPDLRMVNCYQKFLELNMRKGYSYKDIVEGRFAVKVRYADLLLPEFFGGVSRDIDVNSVTQTVDQNVSGLTNDYDKALGSQAGIAGVRGEANANIECFCDEESIIIGLLVVTPLPVYTQLLPKHFTYRGLMEHYQPEFNLIGFQPIKYNEVCPIQAYNDNPASLTETFGYNRPWYEYCQKYDVAHGLFRTDLSNFLMHRVFNQKPELAKSFLLVDPEQVTDVFAVTQTTDKIYGQIWLDCTCKLPIARVAIPRLD